MVEFRHKSISANHISCSGPVSLAEWWVSRYYDESIEGESVSLSHNAAAFQYEAF